MPNKKVLIALGVLVVVVAGGIFWLLRKDSPTNTNNSNSNVDSSSSSPGSSTPTSQGATITYSDSGFSPSTVTVQTGGTVVIKNTSSHGLQFDSDPHPVHTNNPELNVGTVPAGQSTTFTPDTKGTFGYHNHLNASQKGTLIVE